MCLVCDCMHSKRYVGLTIGFGLLAATVAASSCGGGSQTNQSGSVGGSGGVSGAGGSAGNSSSVGGNAAAGASAGNSSSVGGNAAAGASAGGSSSAGQSSVGLPFIREYTDRQAPAYLTGGEAPPATPGSAVSIGIDAGQVLRTLPRTLYGNNTAVWNGDTLLSDTTYQRLSTAGVSILRFPGGSTSDQYHWDGVYPAYAQAQGWANMSQPWAVSTAQYMKLVQKLGSIPVITANYGYATYDTTDSDGTVANAAQLAADWVEYCNAPNDGSNPNGGTDWAAQRATDGSSAPFNVAYWEIGNEIFGNWETGYDSVGDTYAKNFNVIVDAMKAVDPTIAVGLVVDPTSGNENWTQYRAL